MDIKEFTNLILKKKKLVAYFVLVFFTISAVFTVIQPFEYEAQMRLMAVQTFERELEPYSVAKSNQYLSSILVNVITSNSFYDKVIDSKYDINKDYFYSLNTSEIEKWRNVVHLGAIDDTGIIDLQVLHTNKYQAEEISRALVDTIQNNYQEYYKVEHAVEIKVLDKVQVSNLPIKPNVILNLGFGFLFGLLSGLCYIYLFAEKYQREVKIRKKTKQTRAEKVLEQETLNMDRKEIEVVAETAAEIAAIQKEISQINPEVRAATDFNREKRIKHQSKKQKTQKAQYSKDDYNKIVKKGDINNLFG